MNIYIKTFGCKLNQYESEALASHLLSHGHVITGEENAAAVVVNSCTVTQKSDSKLRRFVQSLKKEYPGVLMVVTGCYATLHRDDGSSTVYVPNEQKAQIPAYLSYYERHGSMPETADVQTEMRADDYQFHSRAFLKVQDGCDAFCNYCIVAHARGKPKSMDAAVVRETVQGLAGKGFREFVLTGINIGAYDFQGGLADLAGSLLPLLNGGRLRFSSIEPVFFTDALVKLFAHPSVCRQAHIPLQSASDAVLSRMGRRYKIDDFKRIVDALYRIDPHFSLTTDIMAGHPYETDEDFAATCRFCEDAGFSKLHIFRYSPREGTPSAGMPQIPERVKSERAKKLAAINDALELRYRKMMLGRTLHVVVETQTATGYEGLASEYLHCSLMSRRPLEKRSIVSGVFERLDGDANIVLVE
ncbi:MAG: tRNA (N(6)-L-threonylcarbamoyladenosine(37)-C(2))-methylthiotransferase MtaB [Spirochaetes bacterium]|nr:tRNA (N(6)-L-threonylcarbamoyladenosine(37)-C(2))-methylthiotransferase MtaB [Spirochaetota bacterium]